MGNNNFTQLYSDGAGLTAAMLNTALQSLTPDISNTTQLVSGSTSGQVLTSNGGSVAASFQAIPDPLGPFAIRNYGLRASASNGALKISVLTNSLATPSSGNAVDLTASNNGATSGTYTPVKVTGALSITLGQSATLGYLANAGTQRIYVYGYISGGTTPYLAVSGSSDLDRGAAITTVVLNASSKNNSALYATAATSVVPRMLGWVEASTNASAQWQTSTAVNVTNNSPSPVDYGRKFTPGASALIGQLGLSASCGQASLISTSSTGITNLSVTIITSGRPVLIALESDGSGNDGRFEYSAAAGEAGTITLVRDSTIVASHSIRGTNANQVIIPGSISQLDFPTAGTHTYVAKFNAGAATGEIFAYYLKLIAIEL